MKGHLRAMLYTLCLAVLIVIEVTAIVDLEGYCNCSDRTTESKTTATSPTTTTPTTIPQTEPSPTATTPITTTPTTSTTTIPTTTPTITTSTTTTPTSATSTTAKPTNSPTTTTPTTTTSTKTTPTKTTPTTTTLTTTTPTTTTLTTTTPTTTTLTTTTPTTTTLTTTTPTTTTPTTTTPTTTTPTTTTLTTTTPTTTTPTTTTLTTTTPTTTTPTTTTPTTTTPTTTTLTTTTPNITSPAAPSARRYKRNRSNSNSYITTLSVMTGTTKTTNNTAINCSEVCKHMVSYTSTLPTTPLVSVKPPAKPHPTKYPSDEVNWGHRTLSIPLTIFVNGNFSEELRKSNSTTYSNYSKAFNESLTNLYDNITGFSSVEILGFFPGSIGCNFSVHVTPPSSFNISNFTSSLRNAPYSNLSINVGDNLTLTIQHDRTISAIENDTAELLQEPCEVLLINCSYDTFCQPDQGVLFCSHKCNINDKCSNDGVCYVDTNGNVACRCREDSTYVYKGDTCNEKVLVFFTRKNTAIIGASAGAVIACLLLLFIFLGARWRHKGMKKTTNEKLSDPEKVRKDNSQIENVPMDGVGKTNPMYSPHKINHQQEGRGNYYPGERSDRDNIYEDEMAYDDGRYYRVLNDPESRSKALVYQPSNMSSQETVPKFDDPHSKPLSHNRRQEIEHQPFHDMANTEQAYAIRRPQLMSNAANSYGYR